MRKIFIITHGKMASGIKDAAELLTGDNNIIAYDCYGENIQSTDELNKILDDIQKEFAQYDNIIFTDLFGGSVNNEVSKRILSNKNLYVVSGVNLPCILEFIFMNGENINDDIDKAIELAKNGLINVNEIILNM